MDGFDDFIGQEAAGDDSFPAAVRAAGRRFSDLVLSRGGVSSCPVVAPMTSGPHSPFSVEFAKIHSAFGSEWIARRVFHKKKQK